MKIWFRVGMEADVSSEELDMLLAYSGQKKGKCDCETAHSIMEKIIQRAELSGETYIVGKDNGGVEDYDNPTQEVSFLY